MPSTGTPASSRSGGPGGAGGAPSAYTDAGPPDRMIAAGFLARISAAGMVQGTISEYTWHSRTRRAISCAYWAPKSTTRTVSKSPSDCTMPPSPEAGHGPRPGRERPGRCRQRPAVHGPGPAVLAAGAARGPADRAAVGQPTGWGGLRARDRL